MAVLMINIPQAGALSLISDEETELFLQKITRPLFKAAGVPFDRNKLHIVNDNTLNAFVSDGNDLFINTGTIISADGPDELRKVVKKYRNIRYILGHSFCGMWEDAVQLVREYPDNVYLELTSLPGRAGVIETLVRGAGSERILFGIDLPWFDEYQAVGGIVGAKISEEEMHNILHGNAQKLIPGF